jgi:DNA modification methylase
MPEYRVLHGDCRAVMRSFAPETADAIVTDPPYELDFMGKGWDNRGVAFDDRTWKMALRIAKPGAHLLAFGGTRTFHRLAVTIEDAGWEIRDCVLWLYGQGFPKSKNERGAWKGFGSGLKPAWEPIILARKPHPGSVAVNVRKHGTGTLNIDGCRIATDEIGGPRNTPLYMSGVYGASRPGGSTGSGASSPLGRWPANLILDEEGAALLDEQSGAKVGAHGGGIKIVRESRAAYGNLPKRPIPSRDVAGGASRFFFVAKASPKERDAGLDEGITRATQRHGSIRANRGAGYSPDSFHRNHHPTVKPITLMRYLCRLITPPGGLIVDPFCGSGTTGCAALMEGFAFLGIEQSEEYVAIANRRIEHWKDSGDSFHDNEFDAGVE